MSEDILSDEAVLLLQGWFSFGTKGTVIIWPPHANMKANQLQLDELLRHGLITHEYEKRRDLHIFRGTAKARDVLKSDRAKMLITSMLTKGTPDDR